MTTVENEYRFLLKGLPDHLLFDGKEPTRLLITQYYLKAGPQSAHAPIQFTPRIRRTLNLDTGEVNYERMEKGPMQFGLKAERNLQPITKQEFNRLRRDQREPGTHHVKKLRLTGEHESRMIMVDIFRGHNKGLIIGEIEQDPALGRGKKANLPPALRPFVVEEITGESRYSNHHLAEQPRPRRSIRERIKDNPIIIAALSLAPHRPKFREVAA